MQASIESAQAEHAQRALAAAAADEDEAEQQPAFTGPSHWAAAAGSSGAAQIRPEDFPALPGAQLCIECRLAPRPGPLGYLSVAMCLGGSSARVVMVQGSNSSIV